MASKRFDSIVRPARPCFSHGKTYLLSKSCGTLPPFSASFFSTSLCSQMFIDAIVLSARIMEIVGQFFARGQTAVHANSFIRSTIDRFQSSFSGFFAASASSVAATSTCFAGALAPAEDGCAPAPAVAMSMALRAVWVPDPTRLQAEWGPFARKKVRHRRFLTSEY